MPREYRTILRIDTADQIIDPHAKLSNLKILQLLTPLKKVHRGV